MSMAINVPVRPTPALNNHSFHMAKIPSSVAILPAMHHKGTATLPFVMFANPLVE